MVDVPDFSGDDFKDDKGIQEERKKILAHKKMIEDCFSIINQEFFTQPSSHRYFRSFHIFKNLKASVLKTVRSDYGSAKLVVSLVEYYSSFPIARGYNGSRDQYLFGKLEFKKGFPKTLICKETIREKVSELFVRMETDFPEHKKFSRKFYVLTEDPKLLTDLLQFKDLNELARFPNMEVEIQGSNCLFRNSRKAVSPKEAMQFTELAKTLIQVLE